MLLPYICEKIAKIAKVFWNCQIEGLLPCFDWNFATSETQRRRLFGLLQ